MSASTRRPPFTFRESMQGRIETPMGPRMLRSLDKLRAFLMRHLVMAGLESQVRKGSINAHYCANRVTPNLTRSINEFTPQWGEGGSTNRERSASAKRPSPIGEVRDRSKARSPGMGASFMKLKCWMQRMSISTPESRRSDRASATGASQGRELSRLNDMRRNLPKVSASALASLPQDMDENGMSKRQLSLFWGQRMSGMSSSSESRRSLMMMCFLRCSLRTFVICDA